MMALAAPLAAIAFAALIIAACKILADHINKWNRFKHIPSPSHIPLPLIGHVYKYRASKEKFYTDLTTRLKDNFISKGHEVGCFFIGPTPLVTVVGPNAAEVLLRSTKHTEKNFMYNFLRGWLGTGLLTSTGQKWMKRRKLLTPTFHFSILESFLEVMNEQASIFVNKLQKRISASPCDPIDIFHPMTLCALDIICETAMGTKIKAQQNSDSNYVSAVYSISELVWQRVQSPWLWWDSVYLMTSTGKKYTKTLDTLHSFTGGVIKDRMRDMKDANLDAAATKKKRLAFLDLLLKSSDDGKILSIGDIQEEVDTFMFEVLGSPDEYIHTVKCSDPIANIPIIHDEITHHAYYTIPIRTILPGNDEKCDYQGDTPIFRIINSPHERCVIGHDTTAAGMSWALFLIGSHLEVQTKIQYELDEVLGSGSDRPITMEDLTRMKYMELVLKECLRHLPSVPVIGRITSTECVMDGHTIPAGTQCAVFPQLINNLENYWPNPDKFDPDRFTADKLDGQHPYAYIPFSAGPRNCIGQKFAMMEEKVVVAHLMRRFTVTSCDRRENLTLLGDVILRPGSGIKVRLTPRLHTESTSVTV